mgnify:CR=1 FL=1
MGVGCPATIFLRKNAAGFGAGFWGVPGARKWPKNPIFGDFWPKNPKKPDFWPFLAKKTLKSTLFWGVFGRFIAPALCFRFFVKSAQARL